MLDCQLEISERTADSWVEILRTYEAKKEVGEATEAAVAQAKASMLSVEASVMTLRKQIRTQENSLSALLGRMPQSIDRSTLDGQEFPDELAVGVPLQILDRRPDIRQAQNSPLHRLSTIPMRPVHPFIPPSHWAVRPAGPTIPASP